MVESQNRAHRQVFHINKDKRSSRRQPNARDEDNATWNILLTTARMRRSTLKAASPPPAQKTSSHFIPPTQEVVSSPNQSRATRVPAMVLGFGNCQIGCLRKKRASGAWWSDHAMPLWTDEQLWGLRQVCRRRRHRRWIWEQWAIVWGHGSLSLRVVARKHQIIGHNVMRHIWPVGFANTAAGYLALIATAIGDLCLEEIGCMGDEQEEVGSHLLAVLHLASRPPSWFCRLLRLASSCRQIIISGRTDIWCGWFDDGGWGYVSY